MDGDKPPFAKEIEDKVGEIKQNLKHVETEEKIKLPTQAGSTFNVSTCSFNVFDRQNHVFTRDIYNIKAPSALTERKGL
ncbi:9824_t:CDS:2 [Dentiscutata heterogama]|uniref:9824_t:CDS:1 n=1 Tax=Dentiscutata heterogama TaxID=1316150 RepID=A0ACA9K167_9GLOM|nr:9824_t:CDS:2 [Dentiscutata heterogama]